MVNITFQSPDWNPKRNMHDHGFRHELYLTAMTLDIDHSMLTVDIDYNGYNYTLAEPAPYMNEEGVECGKIGWKIKPEKELLQRVPELHEVVGLRFGRVIVTEYEGDLPVDVAARSEGIDMTERPDPFPELRALMREKGFKPQSRAFKLLNQIERGETHE